MQLRMTLKVSVMPKGEPWHCLESTKPGCQPARDNNILTENPMYPTRVIYIVRDPCASEITTVENKRITQQKGLDESKQEKRDLLLKHFPACS
ncbi:hypothetical protein WISP_59756 [Willisornis vidua]|uniref:Sulfotransferase n=1 Tax=Willisornis vidua TaxID=1566151 RepID=A0ABQ9DBK9_9PASS|nr:hypothetical protein WISP_59756 [Willisornis vidua]